MRKMTLALITLALISSTATAGTSSELPKVNIGATPTHVFDNLVYLSASCAREDYRIFAVLRVDTVIDLSAAGTDREAVEQAGLRYLHVPLEANRSAGLDGVATVLASLERADRDRRVLVHDHDGEAIGAVWAIYRTSAGVDLDTALDEARAMGLRDRAVITQFRELASTR